MSSRKRCTVFFPFAHVFITKSPANTTCCSDLYLLAFSAAGKATLPRSEASELYGSLQERQLRCFTGIKDFLDIDSLQFNLPDDEEAEADGEMDVDDAFRNLADKQKLMPY